MHREIDGSHDPLTRVSQRLFPSFLNRWHNLKRLAMTNEEFINSIKLEGEEWRNVVGYEGRYVVSNLGRVAAYSAPYLCGDRICRRKPQLIKPRKGSDYYSVVLSDGEKHRKSFVVHRLVASAFLPNQDNLPYINHKDENPENNKVDNLEWCTQSYNCNYGGHNARMAKTIHETAYQRKKVVQLTIENIFIAQYVSIVEASKASGICQGSISLCCRGLRSQGGGYKWMYLENYENLANKSKNSQSISD